MADWIKENPIPAVIAGLLLAAIVLFLILLIIRKINMSRRRSDSPFDEMDGQEFERFCANLLSQNGFENVRLTKGSGDQGVDILAEKDDVRFAIQCKCYSSPLGNTPVQEVFAGKVIYNCHVGVVMTNSTFTSGAREAAEKTGVILWDINKIAGFMETGESRVMRKRP